MLLLMIVEYFQDNLFTLLKCFAGLIKDFEGNSYILSFE